MNAEAGLLAAARAGDDEAFVALTAPHRRALHVHCYRLLGSLHDADDALQETWLRAWRGLGGYQPRSPLTAWLYRIATNVCLRMLEQRARRDEVVGDRLAPYPDRMLAELPSPARGLEAEAELREGVGLAFIAAMQFLPPRQRVVLVLRDALSWTAAEVAELLGESVPAVNSALQRARAGLADERRRATLARRHRPADPAVQRRVMRHFQEAWEAVDVPAIVALLADDAILTMPPVRMRFQGAAAIGGFFATVPVEGRLDRITLVDAGANGQPALASYADAEGDGRRPAYGVMVFAIEGDRIAGITGFPRDPGLFTALGLPLEHRPQRPGTPGLE